MNAMARRPGRPKRDEVIEPTSQTLAKLAREWCITRLLREKSLAQEHEAAAREIDMVWRAIMRGLFRTQKLAQSSRSNCDATDVMSEYEAACHAQRYLPWAREEAKVLCSRWPRVTRFDLSLAVCTTDVEPESMYPAHSEGPTAVAHLRMSLDRYARMPHITLDEAAAG